jgi:acetyltransferase-like isoleucine patch superfamily enzyme
MFGWWISMTYPFSSLGGRLSIQYPCEIDRAFADHIAIGSSVILRKDVALNISVPSPQGVMIDIGDNCTIGARGTISARNLISIEKDVILATSVLLQDHDRTDECVETPSGNKPPASGGRIRVETGCWIGQGAAIMCGGGEIVIGRNSVVGANCVVTKSVPPFSVVVGNPGRVVKQFDPRRNEWRVGLVPTVSRRTI